MQSPKTAVGLCKLSLGQEDVMRLAADTLTAAGLQRGHAELANTKGMSH